MEGTMTDRERFNRQMRYQPVDRCFNMEFGYWDENFKDGLFYENNITSNHEADIFFNFDRIEVISGRVWLNLQIRSCGRADTTLIMMNGDGLLAEVPKDGHDTIPHYVRLPLSPGLETLQGRAVTP